MPKNQHHPTPDELDERVKLDLDPELAIRLVMETGEGEDAPVDDAVEPVLDD